MAGTKARSGKSILTVHAFLSNSSSHLIREMCDFKGPLRTLGKQKQGQHCLTAPAFIQLLTTLFFFSLFRFVFNPSLPSLIPLS